MATQVFGSRWGAMFVEIAGCGHQEMGASTQTLRDKRRIAQFAEPHCDVDVFGNEVHEHVGDEQIDLDLGIRLQKCGQEIKEGRLPEGHGNGDPQQPLRSSLCLAQHPLRVAKLLQRFAAFRIIGAPRRRETELARRALDERDAQLLLERRDLAADGGDRHPERTCRPAETLELGNGRKDRDIVQIDHGKIFASLEK